MAKSEEFINSLEQKAWVYIQECLENTATRIVGTVKAKVKDRHIPTIGYFLRIWLPMKYMDQDTGEKGETITRETWYNWLHQKDDAGNPNDKSDTIQKIDELFKTLATDIVANEGKGIFYAKNRLGMTDRMQHSGDKEQPLFGPNVNK